MKEILEIFLLTGVIFWVIYNILPTKYSTYII